jgi:hypothetical protein
LNTGSAGRGIQAALRLPDLGRFAHKELHRFRTHALASGDIDAELR